MPTLSQKWYTIRHPPFWRLQPGATRIPMYKYVYTHYDSSKNDWVVPASYQLDRLAPPCHCRASGRGYRWCRTCRIIRWGMAFRWMCFFFGWFSRIGIPWKTHHHEKATHHFGRRCLELGFNPSIDEHANPKFRDSQLKVHGLVINLHGWLLGSIIHLLRNVSSLIL